MTRFLDPDFYCEIFTIKIRLLDPSVSCKSVGLFLVSSIFRSKTKSLDFHSDLEQSMNTVVFYYL